MITDLRIRVGDRIEVLEGSWFGRRGAVTEAPEDRDRVKVRFDDTGEVESVIACTMAREVPE